MGSQFMHESKMRPVIVSPVLRSLKIQIPLLEHKFGQDPCLVGGLVGKELGCELGEELG